MIETLRCNGPTTGYLISKMLNVSIDIEGKNWEIGGLGHSHLNSLEVKAIK